MDVALGAGVGFDLETSRECGALVKGRLGGDCDFGWL